MTMNPGLASKIAELKNGASNSIEAAIGIEFQHYDPERVVARMPVDQRTRQPFGLLHGGASVVLAESLASVGAWLNVDEKNFHVVGIEINANHLRSVRDGYVTGTGLPIHRGRSTQVWEVRIENDQGQLVCISRCTLAVVAKA